MLNSILLNLILCRAFLQTRRKESLASQRRAAQRASMFSALKRLTTGGGTKVEAPLGAGAGVTPMASSLQKKFSRGVHYNSEIFLFLCCFVFFYVLFLIIIIEKIFKLKDKKGLNQKIMY